MDDSAIGPVFRTKTDELRFNFIRAYEAWIGEKAKAPCLYAAIETAWQSYCYHRDAWVFGTEFLELTQRQKRDYMISRAVF